MVPWCPGRLLAGSSGAGLPGDMAAMRRQVLAAGRVSVLVPRPLRELSGVRGTLLAVLTVEPAGAGGPTGGSRGC